jgi:secreted PhoX family phosphatase
MRKSLKVLTTLISASMFMISTVVPSNAAAGITYMAPVAKGVSLDVIATAGDTLAGDYLLGGVPDGMGVIKSGNNLKIITNHEWSNTNAYAVARSSANYGTNGSYISEMQYDLSSKKVVAGKDFMKQMSWFNYTTGKWGSQPVAPSGAAAADSYGSPAHTYVLNRFCSSTLAAAGVFYDKKTGAGYKGTVYLTGEEGADESRGFAVNETGDAIQIPRFGLAAWETFVPAHTNSKATVVFGNEDGSATDSQLWMYVGSKQTSGTWYDKAGFTNGKNYVLATDVANDNEFRSKYGKSGSAPISFKEVNWNQNGAAQNLVARESGMELARVEDGHFDPKNPNDYYFVTTESNKDAKATASNPSTPTVTRDGGALWRLRLTDVKDPLKGGTLTMLLDGSEDTYMSKPDNIVVDDKGNILIQEDPGNNAHIARVVSYRISDGKVATIAQFKSEYFDSTSTTFITQDEESSGIVDVTEFYKSSKSDTAKYYMLVAQVHATVAKSRPDLTADKVNAGANEGGQWYVMKVSDWSDIYS